MSAAATRTTGRTRPPTGSHDRLVDSARTLFTRDGYEATPVRAIAAEAGLTIGAFYNYFPSKRDVLREVVAGYAKAGAWQLPSGPHETEARHGARRQDVKADDARRIGALLLTLASFAHEDPASKALLRTVLAAAGGSGDDTAVAVILRRAVE